MDDSASVKQYPMTITINTPMHTPRLRGLQAHGPYALGALGDNIRVRVSRVDREIIERVARDLGMNKAELARWCTLAVVMKLDGQEYEAPVVKGKIVTRTVHTTETFTKFIPNRNDDPDNVPLPEAVGQQECD